MKRRCLFLLPALSVLAVFACYFFRDSPIIPAVVESECKQAFVVDTVIQKEEEPPFCILSYVDGDTAYVEMIARDDSCFDVAMDIIRSERHIDSEWRQQRVE